VKPSPTRPQHNVLVEGDRDLFAQPVEGQLANAPDDRVDLARVAARRLDRKDDQEPQEARVALQGRDRRRDDLAQVLRRGTHAPVRIWQVGEEPLGAALHDRQQDPVLGAVEVVPGPAGRQADRLLASIDAAANAMGMVLDLQLNKRAYLVSVVATIFVPLTFITGFFGMNFGWMVDRIDTQVAVWLLGFVVPAATAALSWRLLLRRFVIGDER
jgi:hypothetical protein